MTLRCKPGPTLLIFYVIMEILNNVLRNFGDINDLNELHNLYMQMLNVYLNYKAKDADHSRYGTSLKVWWDFGQTRLR